MRVKQGAKLSSMLLVFGGLFLVFLYIFSALLFPAASGNAKEAGAEVGVTVKEFIKLAVDTTNLALRDSNNNTSPVPTAAGTMLTGDLNIAVSTNATKGYSLSAYTADNSTSMSNSRTGATTKINSIASISGYDATTGMSDLSANTWGFQKYTSGSYSNWFGVGSNSENGTIIASTNSDDGDFCENLSYPLADTGCSNGSYDTYTVKFGAKLTNTLPAGTYTNNVIFSAVAKSEGTKYTLNFNANNANATGIMAPKTILEGSTVALPKDGFSRSGYYIAGWALTSAATTATYTTGQIVLSDTLISAAIAAGQSINSLTLYAIWDEDMNYMHRFNCAALADGATDTVTDKRDGSTYTIKKFGTGASAECWMTQNLRLGYDKSYTLTAELTNIPDSTTYYLPSAGHRGSTTSASTLTSTDTATFDGANEDQAHVQYAAAGSTGSTNPQNTGFYNFNAASLGYSGYTTGEPTGDTPRDICPAGWRLPYGYSTGDRSWYKFYEILNSASYNNLVSTTGGKFPQAGAYYTGTHNDVGSYGYYWSSTINGGGDSFSMIESSGGYVNSQNSNGKYCGFAIRCVAK